MLDSAKTVLILLIHIYYTPRIQGGQETFGHCFQDRHYTACQLIIRVHKHERLSERSDDFEFRKHSNQANEIPQPITYPPASVLPGLPFRAAD